MRVLVADPDPVTRFLLRRDLANAGHECVAVDDGLSAWETYRRALPDVVIAADAMPHLAGAELCKRIRTGPAPDAYLMLLTGHDPALVYGARAGADDFIRRPIVRGDLEVRLRSAERATADRRVLAIAG